MKQLSFFLFHISNSIL